MYNSPPINTRLAKLAIVTQWKILKLSHELNRHLVQKDRIEMPVIWLKEVADRSKSLDKADNPDALKKALIRLIPSSGLNSKR